MTDEECILQHIMEADLNTCLVNSSVKAGGGQLSELFFNCIMKQANTCQPQQTSFRDLPQNIIFEIGEKLDGEGRRNMVFLNKLIMETFNVEQVRDENRDMFLDILIEHFTDLHNKYPFCNLLIEFKHWEQGKISVTIETREDVILIRVYDKGLSSIPKELSKVVTFENEYAPLNYNETDKFKQVLRILIKNNFIYTTPSIANANYFELFKQFIKQSQADKVYDKFHFYYMKEYDRYYEEIEILKKLANETQHGSGLRKKYKGHSYKIRIGSKGGKYIVVKGKKIYV